MSYSLEVRSDGRYSKSTPRRALVEFISRLPSVRPNGGGFVLDDPPLRWMEIEIEVCDDQGNWLEKESQNADSINCIRMQIPSAFADGDLSHNYFPTALAIAEHVGWPLVDENDAPICSATFAQKPASIRPWWKFW